MLRLKRCKWGAWFSLLNDFKFKDIPEWNEYVKENHDMRLSRDAFRWWTFNNRQRLGPI